MNPFTRSQPRLSTTTAIAVGLLLCVGSATISSLQAQQAEDLRVSITFNDDRRQIGILGASNEQGISFALQKGATPVNIPYSNLKMVEFQDAAQYMQAARAAYISGDWEMAEAGMAQVADAFPQGAFVPNSFVTEARFYQMDSLRKLGRYGDIGRLFTTPSGKALEFALSDVFDKQVAMLRLWAYYGAGNIEALGKELESYLQPQLGDAKMLPDAQFRNGIPEYDLAQLAFLRAKVHQAADRIPQALEDYYRTFTLTQGNQDFLAREAMNAAMAIQAAEAEGAEKPSKLWPIQSLAYVYKNAFNGGDIAASLADYAVKPDLPDALAPAPAEEEPATPPADDAAKGDDDKPATPPAPAPPADDKKPADNAKDKAKGKGKGE